MEVGDGGMTSFWYDRWLSRGRLKEILGSRGIIDLGVGDNALVKDVLQRQRRRRHRSELLNNIEQDIAGFRELGMELDRPMWKCKENKYKSSFSSKETWLLMRERFPTCDWYKVVWFTNNTPKFAYLLWIAMHNRLTTGDKMIRWNPAIDATCILCSAQQESLQHLFFECQYTSGIWEGLVRGLLNQRYSNDWSTIIQLLSSSSLSNTTLFLARYALQSAVHTIWRERNSRKHGTQPINQQCLLRMIDKSVRNRLSSINEEGTGKLRDGLQTWFGTRGNINSPNVNS